MEQFLPVGILIIVTLLLCAGILLATSILGPRIPGKAKLEPYECGLKPKDDAHRPFQSHYYLIAVLFLLFDVEAVFFLPWALVYRDSLAQGGALLFAMGIFLLFFVVALFYIYRKRFLKLI